MAAGAVRDSQPPLAATTVAAFFIQRRRLWHGVVTMSILSVGGRFSAGAAQDSSLNPPVRAELSTVPLEPRLRASHTDHPNVFESTG
jgi:hypothetical protein